MHLAKSKSTHWKCYRIYIYIEFFFFFFFLMPSFHRDHFLESGVLPKTYGKFGFCPWGLLLDFRDVCENLHFKIIIKKKIIKKQETNQKPNQATRADQSRIARLLYASRAPASFPQGNWPGLLCTMAVPGKSWSWIWQMALKAQERGQG